MPDTITLNHAQNTTELQIQDSKILKYQFTQRERERAKEEHSELLKGKVVKPERATNEKEKTLQDHIKHNRTANWGFTNL